MSSATPAAEIISHEIAPKWRKRRIQGTESLRDLGGAATGGTRTCSVIATRGATQVHSECHEN